MTEGSIDAEEDECRQRSYGNCQPPAGIKYDGTGLAENIFVRYRKF